MAKLTKNYKPQLLVIALFFLFSNTAVNAQTDSLRAALIADPNNPALANSLAEQLLPDSLEQIRMMMKQSIALSAKQHNYAEKGRAEYIMGDTWWYAQDFAEAARWFGKSAESYHKAGDPMLTANGYNDMALAWTQIDRYDEALEAYRKSMNILLSIDDNENLPAVLINIGQVHFKLGNIDSNIFYNTQAAALSNIPGLEEAYSAAIGNLGYTFKTMGNFEKALAYYTQALEISKKMDMPAWIATDMNNIANVYTLWEKYDMAKKYLRQAIAIDEEANNPATLEIKLNNLGYAYQQTGHLDSAMILFKRSAEIAEKLGRMGNLAVRKINIGLLYFEKEDYTLAEKYVQEGLETNRKLGIKLSIAGALQSMGMIKMAQKQWEAAEKYLGEALELAIELDAKIILERIYDSRTQLFEKTGRIHEALEEYRQQISVKDSLFTAQSQEKLVEMQARYETEKKQQQIELLLKNNQLQKAELRKKQITMLSLGGGIIILTLSALIIWLLYLQKSRANRKLVEKNLELMKKEDAAAMAKKESKDRSYLPDDEKSRMLGMIENMMREKRLFNQKQITLAGLAGELQTNTSYLSRIINEHYGMNFSNFIHMHRIREAQKMFTKNQHKSMTLEGIAESVGYQSRSTFNTAFKKITGVTPSVFIKNLDDIQKNENLTNVLKTKESD